jgi:hypothetical protein
MQNMRFSATLFSRLSSAIVLEAEILVSLQAESRRDFAQSFPMRLWRINAKTVPQRLKPINVGSLCGTGEPVPFVGSGSLVRHG